MIKIPIYIFYMKSGSTGLYIPVSLMYPIIVLPVTPDVNMCLLNITKEDNCFPFPSSSFYLHLCFRCRLNSTRLCCEATVYTMCRDHCLSRKPGDKRAMYNGCCEMPAVRTAVTSSKSKHVYCNINNNAFVHFKAKRM